MVVQSWLAGLMSRFRVSLRRPIARKGRSRRPKGQAAVVATETLETRQMLTGIVAPNVSYTVTGDASSPTPTVLDVLANDSDDAGPMWIESVGSASTGNVTTQAASASGDNETLVYTPQAGFTGTDTFTYSIMDSASNTATATVTITVTDGSGSSSDSTPTDFWSTTVGETILAALDSAASSYDSAVAVASQTQGSADQDVAATYQSALDATLAAQGISDSAADALLATAESVALAAENSADTTADGVEAVIEASASAVQSASDLIAQGVYNSVVATVSQAQSLADDTAWTTYQGVQDSATATMNATVAAANITISASMASAWAAYQAAQSAAGDALAATTSGSGDSGSGGDFDPTQDPAYLAAVASADAVSAQTQASAWTAYSAASDSAWSTYNTGAQSADDAYNTAIAADQAIYSAAADGAQSVYASVVASAQEAYDASDTSASMSALEIILQDYATEGESVSSAADAYQAALAADQAAYDLASATAWTALQSALAADQSTADSAVAAAESALNSAQASADAAYSLVANGVSANTGDLAAALLAYDDAVGSATETEIVAVANAYIAQGDSDASSENAYYHALDAAAATQQRGDATAADAQQLAIDSAEQTQMLADTAAETAYQIQLDSFAETQALADASAEETFSESLATALAAQATSDAAAANSAAHAINQLTQQYELAIGDAATAYSLAGYDAEAQDAEATDLAAASAWLNWGNSAGSPSALYTAAMNAASDVYFAAGAIASGSGVDVSLTTQNQWAHDVSGGWLTYQNSITDDAQIAANATVPEATAIVNAQATDQLAFAATVIPAIQAAADAEANATSQALQSTIRAGDADAVSAAVDALTVINAQVTAAQAANDSLADDALQEVISINQGYGAVATAVANVVAQFVASATGTSIATGPDNGNIQHGAEEAPPAPAPTMSKDQFTTVLNQLVTDSRICGGPAITTLYERGLTDPLNFDCRSVSDMLRTFLANNFSANSGVTTQAIIATAYPITNPSQERGTNGSHMMVVVQQGGNYWLIDAVYGYVSQPVSSLSALEGIARAQLVAAHRATGVGIEFTYSSTIPGQQGGNVWYQNPAMRAKFSRFCKLKGNENMQPQSNYYPKGFEPPTPTQSLDPGLAIDAFFLK